MQDYEFIFCTEVHKKLKEKVRGKVYVKCYRDELHIEIATFEIATKYVFIVYDITEKLLNGLASDCVVDAVIKDYHKFIINRVFFK